VTDLDLFVFGDGRQVEPLVPRHQFLAKDLEHIQLFWRQGQA
jgi:hypothetical protein